MVTVTDMYHCNPLIEALAKFPAKIFQGSEIMTSHCKYIPDPVLLQAWSSSACESAVGLFLAVSPEWPISCCLGHLNA